MVIMTSLNKMWFTESNRGITLENHILSGVWNMSQQLRVTRQYRWTDRVDCW